VNGLRVRGCDRKCEPCPLLEFCGGIKQYNVKGYRCFEAGCELGFPAIKRMQECNVCHMGRTTWDLTEEAVTKLVTEVESFSEINCNPAKLPSVVPIVSLKAPASYDFGPLAIDALVVMFEDLFDEEVRKQVEKAGDINSYLNYNGKVLLSSIMPDNLITREDIFYLFFQILFSVNDLVIRHRNSVRLENFERLMKQEISPLFLGCS
jgi:hypothetical protein